MAKMNVEDRIRRKSVKVGTCQMYMGTKDAYGYGSVRLSHTEKPYVGKAHRLMYKASHPDWDGSGVVMHTCDTPACVNPEHLMVGTQRDNLADMRAKSRQVNGSKHGMAKLDEAQVAEIKRRGAGSQLAAEYGVTRGCIDHIRWGNTWTHVNP